MFQSHTASREFPGYIKSCPPKRHKCSLLQGNDTPADKDPGERSDGFLAVKVGDPGHSAPDATDHVNDDKEKFHMYRSTDWPVDSPPYTYTLEARVHRNELYLASGRLDSSSSLNVGESLVRRWVLPVVNDTEYRLLVALLE